MSADDVDFDATVFTSVPPPPPRTGEVGGTNSLQPEGYAAIGQPFLEGDTGGSGTMRLGFSSFEFIHMLLDAGMDEQERAGVLVLADRLELLGQGFFLLRASILWRLPGHLRNRYRIIGARLLRAAARSVQV
jgi:hypothetical protein